MVGVGTWGGCGNADDDQQQDTECQSTEDCSEGERCRSGACIEPEVCEQDTDCDSQLYCGSSVCLEAQCSDDSECQGRNICRDGACRTGCRPEGERDSEATACPDGFQCSSDTYTCERVGCTMGSCSGFQECDRSLDTPECAYTGGCGGDNADAVCRAFANQEGFDAPYICDEAQGECIEKPACDDDSDCASGEICDQSGEGRNECRSGCRCTDGCERSCSAGEVCTSDNTCVERCNSNEDCRRENPGSDWYCVEQITTEAPVCVRGCNRREDCGGEGDDRVEGLTCRSTQSGPQVCQPCTDDSQCPADQLCKKDLGATEEQKNSDEVGLCDDKPPPCPEDSFGENHNQRSAHQIQNTPFDEKPRFCRNKPKGDWFTFQVSENEVAEIKLSYDDSVENNLDIGLLTGQGDELVSSSLPPNEDEGSERIVYGADTDRQLFVHVRGQIRQDNIEYDLDVDTRSPETCEDDKFEPNDTRENATTLPPDETLIPTSMHSKSNETSWSKSRPRRPPVSETSVSSCLTPRATPSRTRARTRKSRR